MAKGEIARIEQFLLLSQCLSIDFAYLFYKSTATFLLNLEKGYYQVVSTHLLALSAADLLSVGICEELSLFHMQST